MPPPFRLHRGFLIVLAVLLIALWLALLKFWNWGG